MVGYPWRHNAFYIHFYPTHVTMVHNKDYNCHNRQQWEECKADLMIVVISMNYFSQTLGSSHSLQGLQRFSWRGTHRICNRAPKVSERIAILHLKSMCILWPSPQSLICINFINYINFIKGPELLWLISMNVQALLICIKRKEVAR